MYITSRDTGEDSADRMQLLVSQFGAIKYRSRFRGMVQDPVCVKGGNSTRDVLNSVSINLRLQRDVTPPTLIRPAGWHAILASPFHVAITSSIYCETNWMCVDGLDGLIDD